VRPKIWLAIWSDCHEFRTDGGVVAEGKRKMRRLGQWVRIEWPQPGGVMEQANLIVETFRVVRDERARMNG